MLSSFNHTNPNPNPNSNPPQHYSSSSSSSSSLHLLTLLLHCADLISTGDHSSAFDLLPLLSELSSPFGSPADRVASFFADSLRSRLLSLSLSSSQPLTPLPFHLRKLHSAFQSFNSISPLIKFSHFTANQAIYEALDGCERVHVVDLDIMQGLQWPGLFHILASRPRKLVSIRVTGFGPSIDLLSQTGKRLAEFARSLDLPFEFNPIEGKIGNLSNSSQLMTQLGEMTVVHCMHHNLYNIIGSDRGALRVLSEVRPRLVTMVEQDMNQTGSFLVRFVEALHYYSALFDALGEGLTRDSVQRNMVEQQLFGSEIRNILAIGGPKRRANGGGGGDRVGRWREEMKWVGFEAVSLAGSPASQASLLLGMFPWKGYTLMEEDGCLRLGWKDLPLITASAWQPSDLSSNDANI